MKAKQGLMKDFRLKTKFDLVKGHNSHLCILGLEGKGDTD